MKAEEYLAQNQKSIQQECQTIASNGSKAIITVKEDRQSYIHKVGAVEEFIATIPDNQFFKKMRDGVNNAVLNKVIPVVIVEGQKAKVTSFPDYFEYN